MDKKKSLLNVIVSIIFKILLLFGALLARRFLIKYVGNEANGLSSLYTSIIGFLAVAELGVGSAITYCMYKPIVQGKTEIVAALYHLFTKLYLIIGVIILICGFAIMPALPYLAKGYENFNVNLYLTFGMMLAATVLSYIFSSKTSLINAYKNNYITTTINSVGMLVQYVLQSVVVFFTRSFVLFLACTIISMILQWGVTEIFARIKYRTIIDDKEKVDADTKKEVVKNVKSIFMHKIGALLVNTTDSLIISSFIGIVILGKYSNYTTIVSAMTGIIVLLFTPLTSIIGQLCVVREKKDVLKYFNFFYVINFVVGVVFFLGYYSVIDDLIPLLFDEGLELSKPVSFVITLNYFIQYMRQAVFLFRDATGTFYYDRWKPLFEGLLNVPLSIGFVYLFSWLVGDEFAVVGVITATIVTNLTICHIVEPYVLFKHGLNAPVKQYYAKNYLCIIVFTCLLVLLNFCMQSIDNYWIELLVNGCIAIALAIIPTAAMILIDKNFRYFLAKIFSSIKAKLYRRTP